MQARQDNSDLTPFTPALAIVALCSFQPTVHINFSFEVSNAAQCDPAISCARQNYHSSHQIHRRRTASPRHILTRPDPARRQLGASRHRAQSRMPLRPVWNRLVGDLPPRRRSFSGRLAMGSGPRGVPGPRASYRRSIAAARWRRDCWAGVEARRSGNRHRFPLAVLTSAQRHDLKGKNFG